MLAEQEHTFILLLAMGFYVVASGSYLRALIVKSQRIDSFGNSMLLLAVICHALDLGLHLAGSDQYSLYNRMIMVSFMMIFVSIGYLVMQQRYKLNFMGSYYVLPTFILFLATFAYQLSSGIHLNQILLNNQSDSFIHNHLRNLHQIRNIHSALSVLAISFFNLSFINSVLYLMMESRLKNKIWDFWFERLPALNTLEDMGHQSTLLGFLCLTLSILSGAFYHSRTGQTFLHIGLREWMIFLAWLVYVIYFHIRFSIGALGKKLAYIAIGCYILQIVAIFLMIGIHKF